MTDAEIDAAMAAYDAMAFGCYESAHYEAMVAALKAAALVRSKSAKRKQK